MTRRLRTALLLAVVVTLVLGTAAAAATHRGDDAPGCWGAIANPMHQGDELYTALFFAGPPNPNSLPLYTRQPLNADRLDWSDDADIELALSQMVEVGLNTIKLSYWGHEGETDLWSPAWLFSQTRWPEDEGEGPYSEEEQTALARHFFDHANRQGLLVGPMLEVSPAFPFWAQFPDDLDELVRRSSWLLTHFGEEPNWLRVYDQNGAPRHVIWLIETITVRQMDPEVFAAGFTEAAARIEDETGYTVGFIIDPTPLPPFGSHLGPEPDAIRATDAVLAINPFNIGSEGVGEPRPHEEVTEMERIRYARSILREWRASGVPLIAPIIPGYDAHIVFPGSEQYGFNEKWLRLQKNLVVAHETAGISIDTWNGWTEAYAIPPSVEDGDVHMEWATDVIEAVNRKGRKSPRC